MSDIATDVVNVPARADVQPGRTAALARLAAPWIALAVVFALLPLIFKSGSALTMLSLMGIMIVFALSYNMLLGETGLLSFGHAVYYGLGGFFAVHFMNTVIQDRLPVPLFLVPIVGAFGGLVFGIIFGSVSTRRAGTAFAMISLGLGELVASSSLILRGFFGGEEGVSTNRTKLLHVFGLNFGPQIQVYYLIAAWCLVCMVAMYALRRTPFGRMCNAVRENPERAQFVGYNPQAVRFIAFALAGLFAGIAGALAAINFELVNSSAVGAAQSGTVSARRLYRRHRRLHRTGDRRHPGDVARSDAQRHHRRLAALFRPVVHRRGDVRAERHRRPADDARAIVACARLPDRWGGLRSAI